MTIHDADTLELASQLLSFSPARTQFSKRPIVPPSHLSKELHAASFVLNPSSTESSSKELDVYYEDPNASTHRDQHLDDHEWENKSIIEKRLKLERSRRQLARNALEKTLRKKLTCKVDEMKNQKSLYACHRMWTRNDLKEDFNTRHERPHPSTAPSVNPTTSSSILEMEEANLVLPNTAEDRALPPRPKVSTTVDEFLTNIQNEVAPDELLQQTIRRSKAIRKWWKTKHGHKQRRFIDRMIMRGISINPTLEALATHNSVFPGLE